MYLHAQFTILYHKPSVTILFALFQLRFHPMALCSWPVLVQRVCKACRLSPWPTRTRASQLYCSMLRPPTDNRSCSLVTRWCSKVGTQRQKHLFFWQFISTCGTHCGCDTVLQVQGEKCKLIRSALLPPRCLKPSSWHHPLSALRAKAMTRKWRGRYAWRRTGGCIWAQEIEFV